MVSKPVVPPWNDSSKNIVKTIVENIDSYHFHILSHKDFKFEKNIKHAFDPDNILNPGKIFQD